MVDKEVDIKQEISMLKTLYTQESIDSFVEYYNSNKFDNSRVTFNIIKRSYKSFVPLVSNNENQYSPVVFGYGWYEDMKTEFDITFTKYSEYVFNQCCLILRKSGISPSLITKVILTKTLPELLKSGKAVDGEQIARWLCARKSIKRDYESFREEYHALRSEVTNEKL